MNDEQKIREVIEKWLDASARGDLDTILELMAEDIVFLLPGREPMRRDEFVSGFRAMAGKTRIEGVPEIQEIHIAGDYAYCWNYLSIAITPAGGAPMHRAGNILSVFRKKTDGRWVLYRDANLLTPV